MGKKYANFHFILFYLSLSFLKLIVGIRQEEILCCEKDKKFVMGWEADFDKKLIIFDVRVKTNGYVGFGLSRKNSMTKADIVIGGVFHNGSSYFTDRFSEKNEIPKIDEIQNWNLLNSEEIGDETFLKFERKFDTCDEEDIPINNDTLNIIWAFGDTDQIEYHKSNRGGQQFNLLDPITPFIDLSDKHKWEIRVDEEMPENDTAYICTMHKSPNLNSKMHIIAFDTFLKSELAKQHTHHFVVHDCITDDGKDQDEIFEPLVRKKGINCHNEEILKFKKDFCSTILYVWAVGGKILHLPQHTGYPIGENGIKNKYILLEIHYDNYELKKGVSFETGLDIYYTDKLKQYDSALLMVGQSVIPTHFIPPRSKNFISIGICSSECTESFEKDINVTITLLHSHLAGRRLKLRHFRDNFELPWIANDDNYDFDYQQSRLLREEIVIKPKDQLIMECTYDTSSKDDVTLSGESTYQEMCAAVLWYYPKIDLRYCFSFLDPLEVLEKFGIKKIDWSKRNFPITEPENLGNISFKDYLSQNFSWTQELKDNLENTLRFNSHTAICNLKNKDQNKTLIKVTYPNKYEEYKQIQVC